MFRLLSANRIRVKNSRLFFVGMAAVAGYCVFLVLMNYLETMTFLGDSVMPINWFLLAPFSVMSFFCPVFGSIFVGTGYSDGTLRNSLIVGHTRTKIYLANVMTVAEANILITLLASGVSLIMVTLLFGWHMKAPGMFLLSYISGLMMLTAFSGFYTLIAMTIDNRTVSTVLSVTAFLGGYIITGVIRRLVFCFYNNESVSDVFSFLSEEKVSRPLLEFLYDFLPMGQCLQLTTDTVFHPFRLPLYSFLFTGLTLFCGIGIFGRKDVK